MTNQEVNEAVARKLGWVQCCNPKTMEHGKIVDCFGWSKGGSHFHEPYPNYTGSIQAAWEIVESLNTDSIQICKDGKGVYSCAITGNNSVIAEYADTAQMAICLAFLKLEDK